jgi:hypothetical protein
MAVFSCSYCRFSIRPRVAFLSVDYCPCCLAKRHVAVPLHVVEEPDSPPSTSGVDREHKIFEPADAGDRWRGVALP